MLYAGALSLFGHNGVRFRKGAEFRAELAVTRALGIPETKASRKIGILRVLSLLVQNQVCSRRRGLFRLWILLPNMNTLR